MDELKCFIWVPLNNLFLFCVCFCEKCFGFQEHLSANNVHFTLKFGWLVRWNTSESILKNDPHKNARLLSVRTRLPKGKQALKYKICSRIIHVFWRNNVCNSVFFSSAFLSNWYAYDSDLSLAPGIFETIKIFSFSSIWYVLRHLPWFRLKLSMLDFLFYIGNSVDTRLCTHCPDTHKSIRAKRMARWFITLCWQMKEK